MQIEFACICFTWLISFTYFTGPKLGPPLIWEKSFKLDFYLKLKVAADFSWKTAWQKKRNWKFSNTRNSSMDGRNFLLQQFCIKNPLQLLLSEKKMDFEGLFPYTSSPISVTHFPVISSHRQYAGDQKFQHRGNNRCRIRWQWNFLETRKFKHFTE